MLARYLERNGATFPIIILDVSDPKIQEENAAEFSRLSLNSIHRRLPVAAPVYETICTGVREVTTTYASLLPDDDILLPDGLMSALEFLGTHEDFIAAQGYHLGFDSYQNFVRLLGIPEWTPSIDQVAPLERLFHFARRYQPVCYAVYRTEALLKSHSAAVDLENRMFAELSQGSVAVQCGKIARIPAAYRFRRENQSILSRDKVHIFYQFCSSPQALFAAYGQFRQRLVNTFLFDFDGKPAREEVGRVIDLIYGDFFDRHFDLAWAEVEIRKTLGLISPSDLAREQAARSSPKREPSNWTEAEDVIDGTAHRFSIAATVRQDLENREISLSLDDVRRAMADIVEYY